MKNLLKLKGAQQLGKNQTQAINGGWDTNGGPCGAGGSYRKHCDINCHCDGIWYGGCCWICP